VRAAEVLYEVTGAVAVVTINRPEKLNALNLSACEALQDCWHRIEDDPDVRVGIVTAAGQKAFCAGFDISEKQTDRPPVTEDFTPRHGTRPVTGKPLIAAVNGLAMAAGVALVEACDLCVAADHAWFSLPEVKLGIGLEPFVQSLWTLPQRVLFELLVTGDRLTAERGYQLGFVNRVAPIGELMSTAFALATTIAENAPLAVLASKAMIFGGQRAMGMDLAVQEADRVFEPVAASADAQEGFRAWTEKRKPIWQSR
jgi:enoyl-CoA hydratase/carnithine racemase